MTRDNGNDDNDDHEVGYGKPPKKHQFKKGESGNKKGRPKGSRDLSSDIEEVLGAPVTVTEKGISKKVSTQMAAVLLLRDKAMKGDLRALTQILTLAQGHSEEKADRASERTLSVDEDAIIDRLLAKALLEAQASMPDSKGGSENGDQTDDT